MLFPLVVAGEYCRHRRLLLLLLLVEVALIIEVTEEDDEGDTVAKHHHVHGVGEVALCEQVVACVQEEQQKLQQLQGREVSLPPQVLLHVRADGSQPVVRIHHDVDEGVDQADEERLSTSHILDSRPPVEDHGAVVVNMKESHLVALLPQDEEQRVAELYDLGEEKPPADFGHPHRQRAAAVIYRLAEVAVV